MIKLCLVSDTHTYHNEVIVPPCDILIHAGDFSEGLDMRSVHDFLPWFERQPATHKILVAGNHDGVFDKWPTMAKQLLDEFAPSVHYLENSGVEIDGIKFYGAPYTPVFLNWFFMKTKGKVIRKYWNLIPLGTDVLITHGPPYGHLDQSFNGYAQHGTTGQEHLGDEDLLAVVQRVKPSLHIFGHIHGSGGRKKCMNDDGKVTELINASMVDEAYIPSRKPIIVEL